MKSRSGEPHSTRQKKLNQNSLSPKRILNEAETRRDAAKAYGLLASQRNRKVLERKTKKDLPNVKSTTPVSREKCASPKVRLKPPNLEISKDPEELSESASRVQAWLCETPMMSMKCGSLDDEFRVMDAKKLSDTPVHLTVDKSTQTDLQALRLQPVASLDVECQTSVSEHSMASEENTSHFASKDRNQAPVAFNPTSACSAEVDPRVAATLQEEYEVLARIQELKETKEALMAEKRVIQLKIEELKLRQEVRVLMRDVSKARDELRSLAAKEEHEIPRPNVPQPPVQPPLVESAHTHEHRRMTLSTGDLQIRDTTHSHEFRETDGGASHVPSRGTTDTTVEREACVPDPSNNIPSCTLEVMNQAGDSHDTRLDADTENSFQKEFVDDEPARDLQAIKEYFTTNADVRSAPAVLFGALQEEDTESFIKAASYDGVEMLSGCEVELEDVQHRAIAEAIERLAGGRLDILEAEHDDQNDKETCSDSDVISVSLDDEDEYNTMLDSIPLNTTTPEILHQADEEEDRDLFLDAGVLVTDEQTPDLDSNQIHLPFAPVFPEQPGDQQELSATDMSASSVFCSPRNGRSSPRSPRRQLLEPEQLRNQLSPEMEPSASDQTPTHRLASPIPDSLITASSCSSCWVQFSQTDKAYVQGLIAKLLQAFSNPGPPRFLSSNELPISLQAFTAIERESANSQLQEAFDRAIFDTVNQRLFEIYQCLGRLQLDGMAVDESHAWDLLSYETLLTSVQKTVFSTTDCDADPLAAYTSKEHIIEQMLKHNAHRLFKNNPTTSPRFVSPPQDH